MHVGKIGDTPADLGEGTQAGCGMVVGVTSGAFPRAELLKEPHTHLIEQIPELILLLNRGPILSRAGNQNPSLPLSL